MANSAAVQVYTRYKLATKRWPLRGFVYWALALSGLGFLVWVFWQSGVEPAARTAQSAPAGSARLLPTTQAPAPPQVPLTLIIRTAVPPPLPPIVATTQPSGLVNPAPTAYHVPTNLVPVGGWEASRPVKTVFEAQVALARMGISGGSIDGSAGGQTRAALSAFQRREGLPVTARLDTATRERLRLETSPLVIYTVTADDLARLLPLAKTWLGKSQQPRLDYETVLELAAERTGSHPELLRQLNPAVTWDALGPGDRLLVPRLDPPSRRSLAYLRIRLADRTLEGFDAGSRLVCHFPCSIARDADKRPLGTLRVVTVAHDPAYTFNPEVFPESAEAQQIGRKLHLPPGPNNPVGSAWIGLDRPGYGIHGTPRPEDVGRTESHGCFRLSNWNAGYLAQLVAAGLPVYVEP